MLTTYLKTPATLVPYPLAWPVPISMGSWAGSKPRGDQPDRIRDLL
jgi:hypothetical protein